MLTAIAAMFAAVIAWFAAPYLLLARIIVWLLLHKIALAGFILLLLLVGGMARAIPARATQILTALSVLAIIVGWNIYTPNGAKASATPIVTSRTIVESTPSPTPEPTPDANLALTSPTPDSTPTPTPESTPTPLRKHTKTKKHHVQN
jgi:hypothetical protein